MSDVASEAGVAYGLVYHYFDSKDQMLNELFSERWSLLLDAIRQADVRRTLPSLANRRPQAYAWPQEVHA